MSGKSENKYHVAFSWRHQFSWRHHSEENEVAT